MRLNVMTQPFNLPFSTHQTALSSIVSGMPRHSGPVYSSVFHQPVLSSGGHMNYGASEQPIASATSAVYDIQVPPVSKYSGNTEAEPLEE